jgi:hypothetical protein
MSRESLQELLEQHEENFRHIANADDIPLWAREKFGRRPLDKLEELCMEAGGSASSTDGA